MRAHLNLQCAVCQECYTTCSEGSLLRQRCCIPFPVITCCVQPCHDMLFYPVAGGWSCKSSGAPPRYTLDSDDRFTVSSTKCFLLLVYARVPSLVVKTISYFSLWNVIHFFMISSQRFVTLNISFSFFSSLAMPSDLCGPPQTLSSDAYLASFSIAESTDSLSLTLFLRVLSYFPKLVHGESHRRRHRMQERVRKSKNLSVSSWSSIMCDENVGTTLETLRVP